MTYLKRKIDKKINFDFANRVSVKGFEDNEMMWKSFLFIFIGAQSTQEELDVKQQISCSSYSSYFSSQ